MSLRGAKTSRRDGKSGSTKQQSLSPPLYSCDFQFTPPSTATEPSLSPVPTHSAVLPCANAAEMLSGARFDRHLPTDQLVPASSDRETPPSCEAHNEPPPGVMPSG